MASLVNRNVTYWWRTDYNDLTNVYTLHDFFLGTDMVKVAIERNLQLAQSRVTTTEVPIRVTTTEVTNSSAVTTTEVTNSSAVTTSDGTSSGSIKHFNLFVGLVILISLKV